MKKRFLAGLLAATVGFTMLGVSSVAEAEVNNNQNDNGIEMQSNEDSIELNTLGQSRMNGTEYPASIDNSQLDAFPKFRRQGDFGSCVAFSQLYYSMSHMINLFNDLNKTGDKKIECSPAFGFNATNYGSYGGCDFGQLSGFINTAGVLPIEDFPYDGDSNNLAINYRAWSTNADTWRKAQKYSVKDSCRIFFRHSDDHGNQVYSNDTVIEGLKELKKAVTNGYVLSFSTYYQPKHYTIPEKLDNGSANSHGGEDAWGYINYNTLYEQYEGSLKHQMTVVGYDDNIWIDLNGNNTVDPGEKGALKIVDSYQGGDKNPTGFHWVAYDALYKDTQVPNNEANNNVNGNSRVEFTGAMVYTIPENRGDSKLYAKYTLNTASREQCKVCLTAINKASGEEYKFNPYIFTSGGSFLGQGGAYSFRGTTERCDGDFTIDLTRVVPGITADTIKDYKWQLTVQDVKDDDSDVQLKGFSINDDTNKNYYKADINAEKPIVVNGTEATVTADTDSVKPLTIIGIRNDLNFKENMSEVGKSVKIHVDEYGGAGKKTYMFTTVQQNKTEQTGHDYGQIRQEGTYEWTPTIPGDYKIQVDVYSSNGGYATKTIDYTVYEPLHVEFTPTNAIRVEKDENGNDLYYVKKGDNLITSVKLVGGIGEKELVRVEGTNLGNDMYSFSPGGYRRIYGKDITKKPSYQNGNLGLLIFGVREEE